MHFGPFRVVRTAVLLALGAGTTACATWHNYTDPAGPRYRGGVATEVSAAAVDTLRIVSFNVEFGERVDSALAVLASEPDLADADLVLLQEMDAAGTARLGDALGMAWVYYPAGFREESGRDFGNAVLSRWPIEDDEKLVLPHLSAFGASQRIATAATVRVGGTPVRVYSVHLATPINQAERERRAQLQAVLADASRHPRVVLGGDLNAGNFGDMVVREGFTWPTEEGPRTVLWARWDHIFLKGLDSPAVDASGTILDNRSASDHRPVWVRAVVHRGPTPG